MNARREQPRCPVNDREYPPVSNVTLKHHLREPWRFDLDSRQFYCCDDPDCDVIYFDDAHRTFVADQLRDRVGMKTRAPEDTLCFCFGVSMGNASNAEAKEFVISQTRARACACQIRNPLGRCCLKDFPD